MVLFYIFILYLNIYKCLFSDHVLNELPNCKLISLPVRLSKRTLLLSCTTYYSRLHSICSHRHTVLRFPSLHSHTLLRFGNNTWDQFDSSSQAESRMPCIRWRFCCRIVLVAPKCSSHRQCTSRVAIRCFCMSICWK